jgi:hypothetical protein
MKTRLITALLLAGCTSSNDVSQTITITPQTTNVMTCSSEQFTAAVTGFDDLQVSWSANHGSVDSSGLYTSPMTVQTDASVTATSMADPDLSATAQVTLATAFPSAAHPIAGSPGTNTISGAVGVYEHEVASKGDRVYTVWPQYGTSSLGIKVARSDDGGATWNATTNAMPITLEPNSQASVECQAIAIDAGNPDVIYVTARVGAGTSLGALIGGVQESTLVLAVSSDGGATFTQTVLRSTADAGYCADVISPAPNTVIVEDPTGDCDVDKDAWVFSDTNRGAGFATGTIVSMNEYEANGYTHGLDNADGRACDDPAKLAIEQNGTTDLGGGAVESPRLFTANGRVCVTYIAVQNETTATPEHTYEQCSDDLGKTFSPPIMLDPATPNGEIHSHSVGAFGPNNTAAVAFVHQAGQEGFVYVATSTDGGATFGAPTQIPTYSLPGTNKPGPALNVTLVYDATGILWVAYRVDDGGVSDRIVVDKSCDGGTTWSGSVLVNGTEQQITDATFANMKWPALLATTGKAPRLMATGTDTTNVFDLAP